MDLASVNVERYTVTKCNTITYWRLQMVPGHPAARYGKGRPEVASSARRPLAVALALAGAVLAGSAGKADAAPKVVASIKPVHSLVAGVMGDLGTPKLLVTGAASPHTYALKPSDAQALGEAEIVFWVGPRIETFLAGPLSTLAEDADAVALADAPGVEHLPLREGGTFEAHHHADEDAEHGHAADHEEAEHVEHEHAEHEHAEAADGHGEAGHDEAAYAHEEAGHEHDETDAHVWLDPKNAEAMVSEIAAELAKADPQNADAYRANAEAMRARLEALSAELKEELVPVSDRAFVVFHDAYQYLEHRFGLSAAGSITVSPEVAPGAQRIYDIRAKIEELGAACVFAEPQFTPKLVETLTADTGARSGVLDPLGAGIDDGPDLYFQMLRANADALKECLSAG